MEPAAPLVVELVRAARTRPGDRTRGADGGAATEPGLGDDADAVLDAVGHDQAEALAAELGGSEPPVVALYAGPEAAPAATLAPLARAMGLAVVRVDGLAAPDTSAVPTDGGDGWLVSTVVAGRALRALEHVLAAVAEGDRSGTIVVCAARPVVAALAALLAGRDGLELTEAGGYPASRVRLTLDTGNGRVVATARVPPPPVRPSHG